MQVQIYNFSVKDQEQLPLHQQEFAIYLQLNAYSEKKINPID